MPYELTLRPKSASPVTADKLRDELLSMGLQPTENSVPSGLLSDGFGLIEIGEDPAAPGGLVATVKLPYCRSLEDVCKELLTLAMIARVLNADLLDGDEPIELSASAVTSKDGLAAVLGPFCARYVRASQAAAAIFGVARPPRP